MQIKNTKTWKFDTAPGNIVQVYGTSSPQVRRKNTGREIFSKYYQIKPKSDCIYHAPIDLEQQVDSVRLLFQINRKMVNTI